MSVEVWLGLRKGGAMVGCLESGVLSVEKVLIEEVVLFVHCWGILLVIGKVVRLGFGASLRRMHCE